MLPSQIKSNTSDVLNKIRHPRKWSSSTTTTPQKKRSQPLIIRCLIPIVMILILVYVILFMAVDEVDIFKYFHSPTPTFPSLTPNKIVIGEIPNELKGTTPPKEQDILLKPSEYATSHQSMLSYLHNTPFLELSPDLQTIKLHELFRYEYNEILINHLKTGKLKIPTDYELSLELTNLYDLWNESEVNFIQIGSCDGDWKASNDPIQRLIVSRPNWHGVMMEPVPYIFDTLSENIRKGVVEYEHRIYPLNAALSDIDGIQTFYIVNEHFGEELPNESHALKYQIGSFNKEHIIKHIGIKKERGQLKNDLDYYITGINVQSMTPNTVIKLFRDSGKAARDGSIDIVTIDAEGYDYIVLKQFLENTNVRPILIMYENLHLSDDDKKSAVALLKENGYIDVVVGWNTLGIRTAYL